MPSIHVECLPVGGSFETNCYLVENAETGEVIVADAGADAQAIIQAVGLRRPVAVLATHGHFDHIAAVDEVCAHFQIPLYMHEADIPKLLSAQLNESATFGYSLAVQTSAIPLTDEQHLSLAGLDITVLHTPGHSAGSCCFLLPDHQGVLCGDTLFLGGYGRTDFSDGNFGQLKNSLRRLLRITPKIPAYPGHGSATHAGRDQAEKL